MQTLCQRLVMSLDCSITPNFCFGMPWAEHRHRLPSFTAFARFLPVQLITKGVPTHESLARAIRPRDPPGGALVAAAALPDDLPPGAPLAGWIGLQIRLIDATGS